MPKPTSLLKGFEKTVSTVQAVPGKRQVIFDDATIGLALIVSPKGKKTFTIVARNPAGKQIWKEVAKPGELTIPEVRAKASEGVRRIKQGLDPFPETEPPRAPDTFRKVSEDFLALHVKNKERPLRSAHEVERQFKVHFWPAWGDREFTGVRRGDVARLLDQVEQDSGAGMADHLLATISKLANWYAARDENYVSPIIRGMRRTRPSERARSRILTDEEIRALWVAASRAGTFGAFLKLNLLTGQRRGKVGLMRWDDVAEGVWTIPSEAREKSNAKALRLPPAALDILDKLPRIEGNSYVVPGRFDGPFNGYSKAKLAIDKAVGFSDWVIHDLRRTAKSLMRRAGVDRDISERVLGHAIAGVEGVYDRHNYFAEKAEALEKLAALVERIINPPGDNVVQFAETAA